MTLRPPGCTLQRDGPADPPGGHGPDQGLDSSDSKGGEGASDDSGAGEVATGARVALADPLDPPPLALLALLGEGGLEGVVGDPEGAGEGRLGAAGVQQEGRVAQGLGRGRLPGRGVRAARPGPPVHQRQAEDAAHGARGPS